MSKKCGSCGTLYDGWECPHCSLENQLEETEADFEAKVNELKADFEADVNTLSDSLKEHVGDLADKIEDRIEESQAEIEASLEDAVKKQRESIKNADQLQAESKIENSIGLIKSGLYDKAIDILTNAISLDKKNIFAYIYIFDAYEKKGQNTKAEEYISEAIGLLRYGGNGKNPLIHASVLLRLVTGHLSLLPNFVSVLNINVEKWRLNVPASRTQELCLNAIEICVILASNNLYEPARRISNHLVKELCPQVQTEEGYAVQALPLLVNPYKVIEKTALQVLHQHRYFNNIDFLEVWKKSGLHQSTKEISLNFLKFEMEHYQEQSSKQFLDDMLAHNLPCALFCFTEAINYEENKKTVDYIDDFFNMFSYKYRKKIIEHFVFFKNSGNFHDTTIELLCQKLLEKLNESKSLIYHDLEIEAEQIAKKETAKNEKSVENKNSPKLSNSSSNSSAKDDASGHDSSYTEIPSNTMVDIKEQK